MSEECRQSTAGGLPLLGDLPDLDGASVLVRVDFNVPLRPCADETSVGHRRLPDPCRPADPRTISSSTVPRVTACTHLGRPKGAPDARWDLGPVREELAGLAPQVELLENLRFDPGETANDPAFVEKLVNGHDAYVNDAFGVSHRTPRLGGRPAGPAAQRGRASSCSARSKRWAACSGSRTRPFVAVVGGAKVADKLGVLTALLDRVDALVVGEAWPSPSWPPPATTSAASMVDEDRIADCAALLASGKPILLPTDIVALEPGRRVRV